MFLSWYAETSCSLVWKTNSEFNNYNDSSNLVLKTDCSHAEFTYYSFKQEGWRRLNEFEPAADLNISYTNHSTNREKVDIDTNKCVYHINIQMTEEMHEHLQGVVFIKSRIDPYDPDYCYSPLLRYNIITPQPECNCNQETLEQTTASASTHLDNIIMTSSSREVIVKRMLPLFCSLICLIFVIAFNNWC